MGALEEAPRHFPAMASSSAGSSSAALDVEIEAVAHLPERPEPVAQDVPL